MPELPIRAATVEDSLGELFRKARQGCPDAVQTLFDQYAEPILHVIRSRLDPQLRSAWDSTDFLQQTRLKLHGCKLEDHDFQTPQAFFAYMKRIAAREVVRARRKEDRQRQGSGQRPLDTLSRAETQRLIDRAPPVHAVHVAEEQWQKSLQDLSPVHQYIAHRLREGALHAEIARELGISGRTVGRVVAKLAKSWRDESAKER